MPSLRSRSISPTPISKRPTSSPPPSRSSSCRGRTSACTPDVFLEIPPTYVRFELRGATFVNVGDDDAEQWVYNRYVDFLCALHHMGVSTYCPPRVDDARIHQLAAGTSALTRQSSGNRAPVERPGARSISSNAEHGGDEMRNQIPDDIQELARTEPFRDLSKRELDAVQRLGHGDRPRRRCPTLPPRTDRQSGRRHRLR